MKRKIGLLFLFIIAYSSNTSSVTPFFPFEQVTWGGKVYVASLPEPFGHVVVTQIQNQNNGIESIVIEFAGERREVDRADLEGIKYPGELGIVIEITNHDQLDRPHGFQISFEYGVAKKKLQCIAEECDANDYVWVRDGMTINFDLKANMTVKKYSDI